ncbi:hypothetical protein QMK61_15835 [Fulvimonas sp. R45]|uniref:hypothetical protein n=1 Tax=Fulvimonas sp. R45 TaxID=3045937 RepID=UPI00265EEE55|nr:hypothetical protein [Fulvimonas sp. R45]MDO1530308.1 hypothetical protein [Fulvimonas sp. R45]
MKAKRLSLLALFGLPLAIAGTATAGSASLSPFPPKLLPVLVNVDASGKVTEASPAMALPPAFDRLLRRNLDELITGPAHSHGRAVSSQFVINLYLRATPRQDGEYDAHFAYVSTTPVPSGRWHWVDLNGRRLALAPDGSYPTRFFRAPQPQFRPDYMPQHNFQPRQPATAGMRTPPPAPPPSPPHR